MNTIFAARRVLTMNPARPAATHVAVRDGLVVGAGSLEELARWGPHTLDARFAAKVLMPGFVEGHSHLLEGTLWRFVYVGFHDRVDPDGRRWPGATSIEAVLERLSLAERELGDRDAPLLGWGFDPIHLPGAARCNRAQLDRVSSTRPIAIAHASLHILNVNSAALGLAQWLREGIDHPGIALGEDGLPTGELKGPEAMFPVGEKVGFDREIFAGDEQALRAFSRLCVRKGVTTATDLASPLPEAAIPMMIAVTGEEGFATRIVPLLRLLAEPVPQTVQRAAALRARSTERLRLGRVKIVADGSIQGFSARMRFPGYFNGAPNGLWYTAPEQIAQAYELALAAGVQVHTHTNGDEATELALECMRRALAKHPVPDHRFTLQHCQLADAAQFRRIAALGLCVNLFSNHLYYWGDAHRDITVGPERAERMNACRTALANGVPLAIHSDAPVTPLDPLFTAWCAVNRITSSGAPLGAHERIEVDEALRAITLGAAYTLRLDGEIGSIEAGKRADFAVLEQDPTEADPKHLKDVPVWGVVQGGRVFAASEL
ncbi:MAG: amidohydrolase [Burkholderiaceae bacterium]|nr:amidohydrolase [Burkholderiaceae bacterium]